MQVFYKTKYKSTIPLYPLAYCAVSILDGVLNLCSRSFGYSCGLMVMFCDFNIRRDLKRMKKNKELKKESKI